MKWLKRLLYLLRGKKPVTFTPDSKWPDLLNPYHYQDALLRKYETQNEQNHRAMIEKISKGARIISEGKVEGPYTVQMHYMLDDGSEYQLLWRASLHWVEPLFPS